jgi:hypothetical protein
MNDKPLLYSMSKYKNNLFDTNYLVSVYPYYCVSFQKTLLFISISINIIIH